VAPEGGVGKPKVRCEGEDGGRPAGVICGGELVESAVDLFVGW
jgi:hypothetical protein